MKRTRLLCGALAMVLIMLGLTTAFAETYIHPRGGYSFTVPEGWLAVDAYNVAALAAENDLTTDFIEKIQAADEGIFLSYVLEKTPGSDGFASNINILVMPMIYPVENTKAFVSAFAQALEGNITVRDPNAVITLPLHEEAIAPWSVAMMTFVLDSFEGVQISAELTHTQVYLLSENSIYSIMLTARTGDAELCLGALETIISSFVVP